MAQSILVIDDEKAIRKTLGEILSFEGFTVDEAADGAEGAKKIRENNYDCILCDIKMPKMDGIDFLSKLMRLRPMPVVMVSTLTERGAEVTLKALRDGTGAQSAQALSDAGQWAALLMA